MTLHRFCIPPERWSDDHVALTPECARQLRTVLRLRAGATVELFDGHGRQCLARLLEPEPGAETRAEVLERLPITGEPSHELLLLQALLKGEKCDFVVEKAVELGATRVLFWPAARSVVRLEPDRLEGRLTRWRRIATEAAEQCGRCRVPEVGYVASLDALPGMIAAEERPYLLVAYEAEEYRPLRAALAVEPAPRSVAVVIGPEGGLAPEEVAALGRQGGVEVTLGRRVLRAETAALAALALVTEILER
ncbi:MAG TPA: 16S rRNA (uracil(1498)-N(3))-methyltransferase [Armatimonadota bacterium]